MRQRQQNHTKGCKWIGLGIVIVGLGCLGLYELGASDLALAITIYEAAIGVLVIAFLVVVFATVVAGLSERGHRQQQQALLDTAERERRLQARNDALDAQFFDPYQARAIREDRETMPGEPDPEPPPTVGYPDEA